MMHFEIDYDENNGTLLLYYVNEAGQQTDEVQHIKYRRDISSSVSNFLEERFDEEEEL